ncbi:MAG: hypothetical protein HZB20_13415 [Chloroflexi bacterium]|nr:hypothetical protein [Chloroflexota bacterium]
MTHQRSSFIIHHSAFIVSAFTLAVFLRLLPGERMIDDAYITFRYARNLVAGLGFVYNAGERVLGTTTPLYTLLMAGLAFVLRSQNFPAIAVWVNALADGFTCALLIPLGESLSGNKWVGAAAGLLYAVAPFSVAFAVGGMETSVFVLLLILTAFLYLRPNSAPAPRHPHTPLWPLTAALALLTRPDALIFIGPIVLAYGISLAPYRLWPHATRVTSHESSAYSHTPILKSTIFFLAPLLLWLAFAALYYGSPLPHSIAAKSAAYHLQPLEGFVRLWQHYSTPFFEQATFEKIPFGNYWPLPGLAIYLSLFLIGALAFARRDRRSLAVTAYPLLYFATFALANPLIFRWYLTPPLPFYFLGLLGGVSQIADSVSHMAASRRKLQPADSIPRTPTLPHSQTLFMLPCLLFLFFSLRAWTLTPDHGPQRPAPQMAWFKLEELYTQVGKELAPEMSLEAVIAAGDIGALGYFSGGRILDTLGLVSPQSSAYYPLPPAQLVITYATSADLIADRKPDYVVFLEVYGRRTLLTDPRFARDYTLRQKIPTDIYGSDGMLVYKRNVTPAPSEVNRDKSTGQAEAESPRG